MSLAGNQLPGGCNGEMLRSQPELRAYLPTICRTGKGINIDGAANDIEPLIFNAPFSQYIGNRFRDRNDLAERPITQAGDKSQFRVVDPAGNHCRYIGKARGKPSQDIGPATTVAMHDIGLLVLQELREAIAKGQIKIAGTEKVLDTNFCLASNGVNAGIRRTDQDVFVATLM